MSMGLMFWIIMLVWFIFGAWTGYNQPAGAGWWGWGSSLLVFVLFLILGWHAFGPPIHG
jgi:hypothetical protein